jgi:hypothetical protein
MRKKLLLLLALGFWPSYSYSDSIAPFYGYTGNAITDQSLKWAMGNVLPDGTPGLDIQNVIYSYRIQKETGEWVTVYVQNEYAEGAGEGYIFRERDDWKPGSIAGTEIAKAVPVGNLPRALWGDGSIEVVGNGSVSDASVVYTYKVTPCFDPQFDPNCPGYKTPVPEIYEVDLGDVYDAVAAGDSDQDTWDPNEDENIDDEELSEEEIAEKEAEEDKDREDRQEAALFEAGRAELFAQALSAAQLTDATQINIRNYTEKTIPGGAYNDTKVLVDNDLPDAQSGLRNGLAQQLLHQQMVAMQYNLTKKN